MPSKISETRQKLEKQLHNQLGTTTAMLKEWENDPYPVDGEVVSKFWKQIENAPYIKIVGDYDCDGICASHILSTAIRSVYPQKRVSVRIPRRFTEGYGINDTIANEIIETMPKGSLILTVDNGIAAGPVLEKIRAAGYKVIVTDHHHAREGVELPKVDMLIDPAVEELQNPFAGNYWCGAGVAFKLCEPIIKEEVAKELEIFAGLATIADCMELKEGNWGLVRRSIKAFRNKKAPESLRMLLSAMGQDPKFINEDHFGFYLGPSFNAPGRLYDKGAIEVLKYLHKPTKEKCEELVEVNNQRKTIRDEEFSIVKNYIDTHGLAETCPIWIAYPGLHEGIVGILAGKIAEEYKRPAIVLTDVEHDPNLFKGSARSYGDFNIFEYLSGMPDLFEKMGGHKGAAGLSMTLDNFELARKNQLKFADMEELIAAIPPSMPISKWEIPGINTTLNKFRPFGEGNAVPKFEVEVDTQKDQAKMIGQEKNHLLIDHDELLSEEQKMLKTVIKDNHNQASEESTEKIIREIQARCNEIVAILIASPTFDHLFIMQDVENFINLVMESDNLIDYSYLYVVYESGTQFYGIDEYFDEVTDLFKEIGKTIKINPYISDKELLRIKGINIFRQIYFD